MRKLIFLKIRPISDDMAHKGSCVWVLPIVDALREYFSLVTANHQSCSVLSDTVATHFELKPAIIQFLPSFLWVRERGSLYGC